MEQKNVSIVKFVRLKSKLYLFINDGGVGDWKAGKISNNIIKKWSMKSTKMFCFMRNVCNIKWKRIQKKNHELGTYKVDKFFLSCFDNN